MLAFANSTIVALSVTALQILTSALAGYALARMKFRGREAILLLIIATLVIPFQLLVIPIFVVLKWGHLLNTYWALILPTAANGFGIFLRSCYSRRGKSLANPYSHYVALSSSSINNFIFIYFYRRIEQFI